MGSMNKATERKRILFVLITAMLLTVMAGAFALHRAEAAPKTTTPQSESETEAPKPTPVIPTEKTVYKSRINLVQFDSRQLQIKKTGAALIEWSSLNPYICAVDSNGLVQATGAGSATIKCVFYVNTAKSSTKYTYLWPVTIEPLQLNKTSMTLLQRRKGDRLSLNNPNAKYSDYWYSSNPSVATVNSNGYVKPKKPGSAVISVRWNNVTLSCNVQVLEVTLKTLREVRNPKYYSNRHKVILAGAGIMDHWSKAASDFGSITVINNGVPYSTFANWNSWYKKLIVAYKPKAVVFCIGAEDIGNGTHMTGEQCAKNMKTLIQKVHGCKSTRKTKLFFCSLPKNPDKEGAWDEIETYNKLMKEYCKGKKYVTYLELNGALMDDDGDPVEAYFADGHSYLTRAGYKVMKKVVVKKVRKAIR